MSVTDAPEPARRKLIAVLYADMIGYSRLISLDDAGTLERLRALRRNLIDPAIKEHGGRIVQTGGDSLLVVFDSIDGAVRCAVKVQQQVPVHDADELTDRAIRFRVGINIGDAIADGTDLHGEAVNVAARLQAECPPGGICVTRSVRDHVHGRLELAFEALGTLTLKNISRPVEAFVIRHKWDGSASDKEIEGEVSTKWPDGRPSLAVLPFQNMSGDTEQDYFCDGIAEEIITGLSRIPSIRVVARNSSFAYKGKSPDVRQVGKELNVRYVLEGSVRKSAARVRVTGQLVETDTGAHLWADRFESDLTDIFSLQDQVTVSVVGAIEPKVRSAEIERALQKPTKHPGAYDLVLQGRWWMYQQTTRRTLEEAARLFLRATEVDPGCAIAHALYAREKFALAAYHFAEPSEVELAEWANIARLAVNLGRTDPETLCFAAHIIAMPGGDVEGALAIIDRALLLNPNSPDTLATAGLLCAYRGDTDIALRHLREAQRISPPGERILVKAFAFCVASFVDADYLRVIDWTADRLRDEPDNIVPLRYRAAALALLGRLDEARQVVDRLLVLRPTLTIARCRRHVEVEMKNPFKRPGVAEAYYEGLRLAGLPE
jgi:adenylate cyclase